MNVVGDDGKKRDRRGKSTKTIYTGEVSEDGLHALEATMRHASQAHVKSPKDMAMLPTKLSQCLSRLST